MCVQRGLTRYLSATCPLHELLAGTQRASSHFGAGHVLPQPLPQSCPRRGGGELSSEAAYQIQLGTKTCFKPNNTDLIAVPLFPKFVPLVTFE